MTLIWLDIARLLERACLGKLTGIDRVELAYAQTLPAMTETRYVVHCGWSRRLALLPTGPATAFLSDLRAAWREARPDQCRTAAARLIATAAVAPSAHAADPALYLLVSHRHLDRPAALRTALRRAGAVFVPLVHDVIPLEYPEYGRPAEAGRHRRRMASVAALADGVVVNSAATAVSVRHWLPRHLPVHPAPLGVAAHPAPLGVAAAPDGAAPETADRPYFLCVGTIEPRKNHLLLLHLWRRLAARLGAGAPKLVLAGHRGWENENILDLLDRCPGLRGHVTELGAVPDLRLSALMAGARALLMPSFAEGYGLPVAEALAHGTPVLCSDLPALRETGGGVPEFLDPLDGPVWEDAVLDYARPDSPRRRAQLGRLPGWRAATWQDHVGSVLTFAAALRRRPSSEAAWMDWSGLPASPTPASAIGASAL